MKNPSRTILMLLASGLLGSAFFSRPVQAVPINGTIDFGGVVTYDTTSLATATRVNIWNSSIVLQDTGDFATYVPNPQVNHQSVTMAPGNPSWIFNSGTPAVPMPGPATPALWKVGGFTFDLLSSQVVSQSSTFLNVTGVGTASGNGFDPTPGLWTFTSTNSSGSNNPTFSFQSQTAVPEPSTVALLGIGGVCLVARKLRARKTKGA
jgi:PEP-CTERM motif